MHNLVPLVYWFWVKYTHIGITSVLYCEVVTTSDTLHLCNVCIEHNIIWYLLWKKREKYCIFRWRKLFQVKKTISWHGYGIRERMKLVNLLQWECLHMEGMMTLQRMNFQAMDEMSCIALSVCSLLKKGLICNKANQGGTPHSQDIKKSSMTKSYIFSHVYH